MEQLKYVQSDSIKLIGLALKIKTSNEDGQSAMDCGALWKRFEEGKYASGIPGKLNDAVYAVYHSYEGDHTKPFSYFIGCPVRQDTEVPAHLDELLVPKGRYAMVEARGRIPECISRAWKMIWEGDLHRAYNTDFEVYDQRSKNWNDAEVDIYLSVI